MEELKKEKVAIEAELKKTEEMYTKTINAKQQLEAQGVKLVGQLELINKLIKDKEEKNGKAKAEVR